MAKCKEAYACFVAERIALPRSLRVELYSKIPSLDCLPNDELAMEVFQPCYRIGRSRDVAAAVIFAARNLRVKIVTETQMIVFPVSR